MSHHDRIEPRLRAHLADVEASGDLSRQIPVVLSLTSGQRAHAVGSDPRDVSALEEQLRVRQAVLQHQLHLLGVTGELHQLTLANAIEASLTAAQIRQVAERDDILRIIWNREEKVL